MIDVFDKVRDAAFKSPILGKTKYQHASIIISRNNKVLAVGRNHYRGELFVAEDKHIISRTVHSEIHALYQVNVRRLKGSIIVNYACSTGRFGGSVIARPCDTCWAILQKLEFKKVFFSTHAKDKNAPNWKEEMF